jgi:hypothetical protein
LWKGGAFIMKNDCCCRVTETASNTKEFTGKYKAHSSKTVIQHFIGMIKIVIPPLMLAFIPKCPICLAGYIAVATGLGVSITTATYLRFLLIFLCIGSLLFFLAKQLIVIRKKHNF